MDDFHREERLQSEVGIGGTGFIDLRDARGGGTTENLRFQLETVEERRTGGRS